MTYSIWSNDFSVGKPLLDGQHMALLDLCKQAAKCMESEGEAAMAEVQDILRKLVSYTETHFREEERLLRECNYPHLAEHRAEHVDYQMKLTGFLLDAGNGEVDRGELFNYLTNWWGDHILHADKAYMSYLIKAEAGAD